MKITKEQVKNWEACIDGYRWFLNKFPEGGDYADIHQGLLNDNRFEDAGWLTEKMYQSFFGTPELPQAEASAGNKMIETLNNMDMPTVESISEWGGQQASSGDWTQQASSGDRTKQASSGDGTQQASSGDRTQQASSGDWAKQASSGYGTKQASSGDRTQQASSGDRTKQASSGEWTQQASSGDWAKQASCGYGTKQASSGDGTQQASCGYGTKQASSGEWTQQASSGDRTQHSVTGRNPKIATSGIDAEIMAIGDNSVVAAANSVSKIVLGEGGCASIAYHDGERTRFAAAYVGENGIEAGVAYEVNEKGEFVKLEESDS